MKKCKECGSKSKYGYHYMNCNVLGSYYAKALAKIKGETK